MKTRNELRFDELTISMIALSGIPQKQLISSMLDFHENSSHRYDALCDILYMLSTECMDQYLWLTLSGEPILSCFKEEISGLFLCHSRELPPFREDLAEQLDYVFSQIEDQIKEM